MEEMKEFLERYKIEKGALPKYYEIMAVENPEMFKAFLELRSEILEREGVLARKTKELILTAVYAATRFDFGLEVHLKRALEAGATKREVFETLALVLLTAGLPGYISGINVLESENNAK